jgi:hypothetical protein
MFSARLRWTRASAVVVKGIQGVFNKLCAKTCSLKTVEVALADLATRLPDLAATAVADQSVDVLFEQFHNMHQLVLPAVATTNAQSRTSVITAERVPRRLFASESITSARLNQPEWTWYGESASIARYEKLWELG